MGLVAGRGPVAPERLDRPFQDPLVRRLFPPLVTGVHWGLERTERALTALAEPHRAYPSIHVGGTNGKGSVASTLASVMRVEGRRTGCYTSPHLCSFRERIMVDGRPLTEEALLAYAAEIRDVVIGSGLTFFEAVTVLAFHVFARERVEMAVMEVGLGGRLDATNVIVPDVSAVTNVAMDHSDFLGGTLREIAREKAGIMKPNVPFVTTETASELRAVFEDVALERGTSVSYLEPEEIRDVSVSGEHTSFSMTTESWGDLEVRTPLVGRHQATNAGLAVATLDRLPRDRRPGSAAILRGVSEVEYHGRDELLVIDGVTWLFDVAHNTAGILSLVDTLDRLGLPGPTTALVGVLGDKDWASMLPPLFSRVDRAVLTQPPTAPPERRWNPASAAAVVADITELSVEEDFVRAFEKARLASADGGTVVVTGSVHTVGGAMRLLEREPLRRFAE
ncbi:MAG: folylpolyglutamate synthase/dihydrofolate synthase family protein [Gemmatimonadota bacterium]|nr:folylpolyglutamate synthase/dihydrofolate synthase family protein [Gemmatimonadota bacterium]